MNRAMRVVEKLNFSLMHLVTRVHWENNRALEGDTMNEAQAKQIQELAQEIADDEGISFDDAFGIAMGILKLNAGGMPKGRPFSGGGGSAQAS